MALALMYATLLAFIPYFLAVWRAPRLKWPRGRRVIVGVALAARAAMLPAPTVLSTDVYRYCWEGKIQNAGFNPYRFAPDAPELTALRDANWHRVEHRDVPTVYPPVLLLVFRAGAQPFAFKLIFAAFDLATMWLLVKLLRARGQNESLALIWAWNPLVVLEFAGNAHAMSLAIFFLIAALWLRETNRRILAATALAAAVLSHLLALPIALAVLASKPWRQAKVWLVFAVVVALAFLPFADAGRQPWTGLLNMAGRWRFNGSVFEVLAWLAGAEQWRQVADGVWFTYEGPKRIAALALAGVMAWTVLRRYRPTRAALTVAGAMLLLSSTVHPWYVTWVVALTCVEFRLHWLALSAFVVVSYVARVVELQTGTWVDTGLVRWMEYAPFFALWLVDSIRRRQ
jgi:alpha-1,6-mannosyltransferase